MLGLAHRQRTIDKSTISESDLWKRTPGVGKDQKWGEMSQGPGEDHSFCDKKRLEPVKSDEALRWRADVPVKIVQEPPRSTVIAFGFHTGLNFWL